MIIATFYTKDTPYEDEAKKLINSLRAQKIYRYSILGCPNRGSWDLNTKWKPHAILRALQLYDDDVLYVDADATFERPPDTDFFDNLDCDVAAHIMDKAFWGQNTSKRTYSVMSGTLFVRKKDSVRRMLLAWQQICKDNPTRWDQHCLEDVLKFDNRTKEANGDYILAELPVQYCAIDKTMHGIDDAVIRHHQASRRLKKVIQ